MHACNSNYVTMVPHCDYNYISETVLTFHIIAIACGPVNQIDNGYFKLTGTGYDSEVIYYCNPGYTLVGSAASSCNDDGLWSDPAPACEGY